MSKQIPLTQGKVALVDDEDFEWLNQWKWCVKKEKDTCYAIRGQRQDGKIAQIRMHREILKPSIGMEVDHKDGNGLNNQRYNLRSATHAENIRNQKRRNGTSKFKKVSWHKRNRNWQVKIGINGRRIHLGHFKSEWQAAKAYDDAAKRLFDVFARTNF